MDLLTVATATKTCT